VADLSNISTIKSILSKHNFTFSKKLGQNFLIDSSVCPRMAGECCASATTGVLEIGPGIGILTCELAKFANKVVAIEIDTRLKPVLDETLKGLSNVSVLYGDVLKLDLIEIIKENFAGQDVVVCANLPYYITSPIIMHLLENRVPVKSITVMVQKEAAERLCATVGTRKCGAVTVAVNFYSTAIQLFDVSRDSFMPAPNVDSAVIRFDVLDEPPIEVADKAKFFRVVKAAFSQRRKTAANSISSGLSLPKDVVIDALVKAEINPNARAEELTMQNFSDICNNI